MHRSDPRYTWVREKKTLDTTRSMVSCFNWDAATQRIFSCCYISVTWKAFRLPSTNTSLQTGGISTRTKGKKSQTNTIYSTNYIDIDVREKNYVLPNTTNTTPIISIIISISVIPHICHNHHKRWLRKFFLSNVKFLMCI